MKKFVVAGLLGSAFAVSACTANPPAPVLVDSNHSQAVITSKATIKSKPVEPTIDGKTASQLLLEAGVTDLNANYAGQVCSYIGRVAEDNYVTNSELGQVATQTMEDLNYKYNTEQTVAIVVSSVMKHCPHFASIIKESN